MNRILNKDETAVLFHDPSSPVPMEINVRYCEGFEYKTQMPFPGQVFYGIRAKAKDGRQMTRIMLTPKQYEAFRAAQAKVLAEAGQPSL